MRPISLSLLLLCVCSARADEARTTFFETNIRPVLAGCVRCHGGDDPAGSLDLTTRAGALKGGETGSALHPGTSSDSLLYRMTSSKKMPPKKPLGTEELAGLRRWIDDGAVWEGTIGRKKPVAFAKRAGLDWWSLQPVRRPTPPRIETDSAAIHNPIDCFVLARLQSEGLNFAPPADRATLLRRVTFDLIGLPPTPEEVDAFVNDSRPDAYERVVDRLLASPHYGERWGRHWLDVARFGESQGFERDKPRDNAWRYRDYVIQSFNEDKPYPRFVREQLAGDVIEGATPETIAATGFLVCGPWDEVGAMQQGAAMRKRSREEELEDMVSAVGQTFLGLTVNCARCHNHKFDPIPQRDYYRLKAALEGVYHGDRELVTPDSEPWVRLLRTIPEAIPQAYAASPRTPEPTFVLQRGDIEKPDERVSAGGPSAVRAPDGEWKLSVDAPEGERRLKLAEWMTHPDNPLVPRVMANRIWQYHFGQGLLKTPSDLGFNGGLPSHPELLDWLASELSASGGSLKHLHRLIVLSSTYRQSSRHNAQAAAKDADNRWLWRFSPRRLEGEAVRDAMLSVSGKLNRTLGGPSFRPFTVRVFNSTFYTLVDRDTPDFNRRTVYRMNVGSAKSPLLESFDCPDPSVKTPYRGVTTTPLQALELMNSAFVLRQSRFLAERVRREADENVAAEITRAYRIVMGRPPSSAETDAAAQLAREHGLDSVCWVLLNASEFLYVK